MRSARLGMCLILAAIAAPGCRTAGVDNFTRRDPVMPPPTLDVAKVVEDNNRNASKVDTLRATSLSLTVKSNRGSAGVDGRLAMERPRNFKLELQSHRGEEAEFGSNDEKFWFWSRHDPDKSSYYCNYDAEGTAPLAATFQPDWIIEALGLRVIPPNEIKDMSLVRGNDPNTLVLTHRSARAGGDVVIRKTILRETDHQILEHRLYSEKMELLARAKVEKYQKLPITGENGEADEVLIPERMRLEWIRERMAMDVVIPRSTEINPEFDDKARAQIFVETAHAGYARRNLASNMQPAGGVTTIRETRPAPPRGVSLEPPVSDTVDGAGSSRNDRDPEAVTASLTPTRASDLVEPAVVKPPELQFAKPARSPRWIDAAAPYLEQ